MTYLLYLRVEILTVKSRNYRTHEILENQPTLTSTWNRLTKKTKIAP